MRRHSPEVSAAAAENGQEGGRSPGEGETMPAPAEASGKRAGGGGRNHSAEARAMMSETRMSRPLSDEEEAEKRRAEELCLKLPCGDVNRELLCLRHGLGIYRRHSHASIGAICGHSDSWAVNVLRRIMAGHRLPVHGLELRLLDNSLKPPFRETGLNPSQLRKLADIMPSLNRQELQIAFRLTGVGNRRQLSVEETNRELFQSATWGEHKIREFKRRLEQHINAY